MCAAPLHAPLRPGTNALSLTAPNGGQAISTHAGGQLTAVVDVVPAHMLDDRLVRGLDGTFIRSGVASALTGRALAQREHCAIESRRAARHVCLSKGAAYP
jgi:hypothetical protein